MEYVDLVGKKVKIGKLTNIFDNSDMDYYATLVGVVIESNMALHRVEFPNKKKFNFYAHELLILEGN